ncbi:MAG: hypothetical protein ACLP59_13435 [Bryobacteraceae bacterium]
MAIDTAELDRLRQAYKGAVDEWVAAIREEEALATPDYSLPAWERWDTAGFKEQDVQEKAKKAKEAFKDGLRQRDYGF